MRKCLNCNEALPKSNKYCSSCGQKSAFRTLSFWSVIIEFLANFFDIDNKIWRTLRDIWVPGKLAKAFIQGKRVMYYNPIRMFLFVLFTFFAITLFHLKNPLNNVQEYSLKKEKDIWRDNLASHFDTIAIQVDVSRDSLLKLKKILFTRDTSDNIDVIDALALPIAAGELDDEHKDKLAEITQGDTLGIKLDLPRIIDSLLVAQNQKSQIDTVEDKNFPFLAYNSKKKDLSFSGIQMSEFYSLSSDELLEKYGKENWLKRTSIVQFHKIINNLSTSLKFLVSNCTWAIITIILLLSWFFKILYFRHNYMYAEHFLVHLIGHTRILLLAIVGLIYTSVSNTDYFWILPWMVIGALFLYLELKSYYGQSLFKTFLKWGTTLVAYCFFMIFCMFLILAISIYAI